MKTTSRWHVVVALLASVLVFVVWVAVSATQAPDLPRYEPVVSTAPDESLYPEPLVDPSAPAQEQAPTF